MQRPQETAKEITAEATQSKKTTLINSEEEDDFEVLSTQSLEEKSSKMTEINVVRLPGVTKVKAVLKREGQGVQGSSPEIRRFSVSEVTHKALEAGVRSVFNIDTQLHCSLFWKDEDDDLVQFSTTEELRHAVESQYDDTLRIYVTVSADVIEEMSGPDPEYEQDGTTRRVTFDTPLQASGSLYPSLHPHPHHHPHPQPHPHHPQPHHHPQPQPHHRPHPWQFKMGGRPFMGPGMHWGRKGRKMMMKMLKKQKFMPNVGNNEEFNAVRQQVPETFRGWVRQYVRTWFQQGAEAANQIDTLPEGAPPHFRQWLHDFLSHWTQRHGGTASSCSDGEGVEEGVEMSEGMVEGEMLSAPEGLPPMYYRWICLFMPRFFRRQSKAFAEDSEKGVGPQCPAGSGRFHGHGMHHWKGRHGWSGKHGCRGKKGCHGKKGWKRGGHSSSSDSEDSDCGGKMWKKIPKAFRKYVRVSVKQLHKNKGDNPKAKEKATRAGLSPEVMEFVEQTLLEWHAKLSQKRPRDVATEMMQGERSLPAGLERDHFLWMCRFMARWHRRHAGKCDVMSAWSSGESEDSSSGEEGQEARGPWANGHPRGFQGPMSGMHGHTPQGMMGHPYHPFPMHHGMEHGCPPPPPYHGFMPPPPPPFYDSGHMAGFGMMHPGPGTGCGFKRGCQDTRQGCTRWRNQDGAGSGQTDTTHDDMERVTEGVKKM